MPDVNRTDTNLIVLIYSKIRFMQDKQILNLVIRFQEYMLKQAYGSNLIQHRKLDDIDYSDIKAISRFLFNIPENTATDSEIRLSQKRDQFVKSNEKILFVQTLFHRGNKMHHGQLDKTIAKDVLDIYIAVVVSNI
ncbi:hypothetical protein LJB89_03115 [Tyzzerella sp. OttesenSCG-928-J15]|nr:hypothetical protein [Tyzzerella sp. OttesenSCG-928-J15]